MQELDEGWMWVLLVFICVSGCATCNHSNNKANIEKHKVHHEVYNECIYDQDSLVESGIIKLDLE